MDIEKFLDINIKTEKIINDSLPIPLSSITGSLIPESGIYPAVFKEFYEDEQLDKINEKLVWIEIEAS